MQTRRGTAGIILSTHQARGEEVEEEAGGETGPDPAAFTRPRGVPDRDWRVYEIVDNITNEFGVKFKTIWA